MRKCNVLFRLDGARPLPELTDNCSDHKRAEAKRKDRRYIAHATGNQNAAGYYANGRRDKKGTTQTAQRAFAPRDKWSHTCKQEQKEGNRDVDTVIIRRIDCLLLARKSLHQDRK